MLNYDQWLMINDLLDFSCNTSISEFIGFVVYSQKKKNKIK